jgi:hypothetical protein
MSEEGSSYKYVSEQEIQKTEYADNSSAGEVYLSPERQEQIKKLMFAALVDPRDKYQKMTIDQLTEKWVDPDVVEAGRKTIDSN